MQLMNVKIYLYNNNHSSIHTKGQILVHDYDECPKKELLGIEYDRFTVFLSLTSNRATFSKLIVVIDLVFLGDFNLIIHNLTITNIRKYWSTKHQMGRHQKTVDWSIRAKSNKASTYGKNRRLSKFYTEFCRVGKMLKLYKYQTHTICPWCNANNKTTAHVLQCPETSACAEWDTQFKEMEKWALKQGLSEPITSAIVASLHSWKFKTPYPQLLPTQTTLCQAIHEQDWLGWNAFIDINPNPWN